MNCLTTTASAALCVVAATIASAAMVTQSPSRAASIVEYVAVVSDDGAPIVGLKAGDFQVTTDVPVTIEDVSPATTPLSIALVVDGTASVGEHLEVSANVLDRALLDRLRPGERVRILTVATSPVVGEGFTADVARLKGLVRQALDGGRTGPSPIWDTLWHAGQALAAEPSPRVILLFSDGRATGNNRGFFEMLHALSLDGITVAIVASANRETLGQIGGQAAIVRPDAALRALADNTGGPYYVDRNVPPATSKPAPGSNAPARLQAEVIVERIMTELRQRYAVRFVVPADGTFHKLRVAVSRPGVTVRARAMFLAK